MCIRLQIGAGICEVITADAVTTGKVNCYICLVRFRSITRGYGDDQPREVTTPAERGCVN